MTKLNFEPGDKIGPYILDEWAGTNTKGTASWYVKNAETGKLLSKLVSETTLRRELRKAELTPQDIRNLSSRAYNELLQEIGQDGIDEIMGTTPKRTAPDTTQQRELARAWFARHPQVPQTRRNAELFDERLAALPNPTFTSQDFDTVFFDNFADLELRPKAVGIENLGEAIKGWEAINKLTASQIRQLQKSVEPPSPPIDFSNLDETQTLNVIGKLSQSADEFLQHTRDVDRKKGIEQPVSPLLVRAREKVWSDFFQIHHNLAQTEELQAALLDLLKPKSSLNPGGNEALPVLNQYLDSALEILIERGDGVVQQRESNTYNYQGARMVLNEPRSKNPQVIPDDSEITIRPADIDAMDAETYGRNLQSPAFRAAVDRLTKSA